MCHCTEYKLSALQVTISEENKLNATTQQFIIARISGCALKQGRKAHSSLCQSNLQLQNQAALMSCPMRAVEHRKYAALLSNTHPDLLILLNYTRIENAHTARKKTFDFLLCIEIQQNFSSLFPAETLSNAGMLLCQQLLFLSSCNSVIMLQKLVVYPMPSALAMFSHSRQNKDNCFG